MTELFRNKYRIPSARLPTWDYSSEGMYFITVCTHQRAPYFGNIRNGIMCLSHIGQTAWNEWIRTPEIRPDMNLQLGEFVVMPNHFHGILIIGENEFNIGGCRDATHRVSTNKFGPQAKNLASVMRGFKASVTTIARKENIEFGWQERYHDHIIRSYDEYQRISTYIRMNIDNWSDDRFYTM